MKRLLSLSVFLMAVILSFAADFEVDDICYNITSKSELTVAVTYRGGALSPASHYTGTVTIPSTVIYNRIPYNVTSIGEHAFYNCSSLKSIIIPLSVKSIGNGAFFRCHDLESITIPISVTSIGSGAFAECYSLNIVNIPNSVTSIGSNAFENCSGLISVTIPNNLTSISNRTFEHCSGLTSITIPASVKSIGDGAFYGCGLKSVKVLNPTPASISPGSFSSYKTLYVPKGSRDAYRKHGIWREFLSIIEFESTAISTVTNETKVVEVKRYNMQGRFLNTTERGIIIIRMSDGTTRKVMAK